MTEPGRPKPTKEPGGTILYIDDSLINQRLVSRIFERQAAAVVVVPAVLGRQGLELARARPDVILLDLTLQDMSGEEVLARLREDPELRAIPVIILSADASAATAARLAAMGARAYVSKPFSIAAFLDVVRPFLPQGTTDGDASPQGDV